MSKEKIYDVVVAGELNVDIILNQFNKFPALGKEVIADQMTITLGSSSAIFASNLSVLGTKVAFVGTVARDYFGDYVVNALKAKGVDTSPITFTEQKGTGVSFALSFDEDRAMVTHPGAMSIFSLDDIPESLLRQSHHLHVSSIFLSTALKKDVHKLFRMAKALGLTTSLDPQWDPEERWDIDFQTLLADVDVFIPNEGEIRAITGTRNTAEAVEALRPYSNILVVKKGREGASLYHKETSIHQRAFLNDHVVDSIGAGDSFDAGFVHRLMQGKSLNECLELAALTGAVSTTRAGGTKAFENLDTVKEISRSAFNYTI